jgi:hypothetical protein
MIYLPILVFKKRMKANLTPFLAFCAIIFLISGCDNSRNPSAYNPTQEEKEWMNTFFTGLMLQQRGIYTLCGSKPMTCIPLHYHSDEEVQAYYDQMTEEEKKTAIYVEDYQLAQNWEKWEQVRARFPIHRFFLFKVKSDDPNFADVYFVDPTKVMRAISENYRIFKDVAGFDFNPEQEAFLIEKGSPFWEKVHHHPVTTGILFGFGTNNSLKFYQKYWNTDGQIKYCAENFDCYPSDNLTDGASTLNNLTLPAFMSFFKEDEVILKYKKEREAIREEYKGKDFLDYTLQKLTMR